MQVDASCSFRIWKSPSLNYQPNINKYLKLSSFIYCRGLHFNHISIVPKTKVWIDSEYPKVYSIRYDFLSSYLKLYLSLIMPNLLLSPAIISGVMQYHESYLVDHNKHFAGKPISI